MLKFTGTDGKPHWISPQHVAHVTLDHTGKNTLIALVSLGSVFVREPPAEVVRTVNIALGRELEVSHL